VAELAAGAGGEDGGEGRAEDGVQVREAADARVLGRRDAYQSDGRVRGDRGAAVIVVVVIVVVVVVGIGGVCVFVGCE